MTSMILLKDELLPSQEAHISYQDRGYYFGDGIYEVFRVYNGRLYETDAHMERLFRSAKEVALKLPYTAEEIREQVRKLCEANHLQTGIVYLQFTRGEAPRSHLFPENAVPVMMGFTQELPRPADQMDRGITAITLPDIRWLRCDIKSLNLLPNTMAKQKARDSGCDDAIFHRDGIVTECSSSNIMIVKNGVLRTHPATQRILHGVTRAVVLRLAHQLNLPVQERAFTLEELAEADEVFITGTTAEVTPVIAIDGRPVAGGKPGPVTRRLQQAFEQTIPV